MNAHEQTISARPVIPEGVLDSLAQRLRAAGVCLLMLGPDGQIIFQDNAAGIFFQRYVVPLLRGSEAAEQLRSSVQRLAGSTPLILGNLVPGVLLAAFSYVERRRHGGVFLLAARSSEFAPSEDVLRMCGRLGLDSQWLLQQTSTLMAFTAESLQSHARMVLTMLRDQVRLSGLEQELESLSGQLANTYEELSLIYHVSSGMKISRGAAEFFKDACLDMIEVVSVRGMGVVLDDGGCHRYEPVLYGPMSLPPDVIPRLTGQLLEQLRRRTSPILINDLASDRAFSWLSPHARQLLAVPLQRQDQILGCLFALDKQAGEFDSVDSKLLNSIGNESAIYLENLSLFQDMHDLTMGVLHSLSSAIDAKDTYTCGHSERVALLSRRLAQKIGLDPEQVERVYIAGLLHDVGKIGVPEHVLQKAGKLTPEEFEIMKRHPQVGARILRDIRQLEDVVPGVLHHHERFDGNGYPSRLSGDQIPLFGRIICLADSFDAMTSSRTYRRALPLDVAIQEIIRCTGTQFDPVLADAFIKLGAEELRQVLSQFHDRARTLETSPAAPAEAGSVA